MKYAKKFYFSPEFVPTSATTNFHAALFITVLSSAGIAVVFVQTERNSMKMKILSVKHATTRPRVKYLPCGIVLTRQFLDRRRTLTDTMKR